MKPEDLLDPEKLPPELKWVAERYKLQMNDPLFAFVAWHWQTVQASETKLANLTLEVQGRARVLIAAADSIAGVGAQIAEVKKALEAKPLSLARQLEEDLGGPVMAAVVALGAAEKALRRVVETVEKTQRRQALAAFVIGVVLGGSLLAWLAL